MPQVDLETLVSACAGGSADRKVACEPLADGDHSMEEQEVHPDSPPESFWLSGDAEFDWWDRNAVYERNESTKGNSISSNLGSNSNSNSQRFSSKNLKYKNVLIGLPKPQKTTFADARSRRNHRPGNARLFPKRCVLVGGKCETAVIEPSSPKVSCIGRVRSKRDRNRRLRTRQRSICSSVTAVSTTASTATTSAAVVRQKSSRSQRKKTGFFASVRAIFRSGRKGKPAEKTDLPAGDSSTKKRNNSRKARGTSTTSFEDSVYSGASGLSSINRLASGRRSESWLGDTEIHVSQ